jgi:hypothetical protein
MIPSQAYKHGVSLYKGKKANHPALFNLSIFNMFKEAFEKLDLADVATILDQVNPLLEGVQFDPVETTIMALDLPFYEGYRFLDIADHTSMPPLQRFVVYAPGKITVLNFSNEPIYTLNRDLPIKLNEEIIEEYVRFFFAYVRGKHGRFLIVENVDDINWKEDPPPTARKAIGKMLVPLKLNKAAKDGSYKMTACMMFKNSLFKSDINIKPNGLVALENEELLIEDMPVLDDTFGQ